MSNIDVKLQDIITRLNSDLGGVRVHDHYQFGRYCLLNPLVNQQAAPFQQLAVQWKANDGSILQDIIATVFKVDSSRLSIYNQVFIYTPISNPVDENRFTKFPLKQSAWIEHVIRTRPTEVDEFMIHNETASDIMLELVREVPCYADILIPNGNGIKTRDDAWAPPQFVATNQNRGMFRQSVFGSPGFSKLTFPKYKMQLLCLTQDHVVVFQPFELESKNVYMGEQKQT